MTFAQLHACSGGDALVALGSDHYFSVPAYPGMKPEFLIAAGGIIGAVMGAAAFFSRESTLQDKVSDSQQVRCFDLFDGWIGHFTPV